MHEFSNRPDVLKSVQMVQGGSQWYGTCSKKQEAAVCRDPTSRVLAYNLLRHLLRQIPTHIAYGSVSDYLPAECQDDVLHNASGGIENFASVVRVEGAGHLVTHTHPSAVAGIIWDTLVREAQSDRIYANSRKLTRAKL
ncbi:hypothetical protein BV22DRAFT_1123225 [Leucogyrophana mollusca]|uniref:Uncharacterized protein n=1 Tax=Leucogyrophana mollusca TaxID=85980 RepID=A0ACB8B4B1_9AGAM|nr:hypothetical protein BV22DRAFT_1123225 [Leucogyrophana mollusca]